MSDHGYMFLHGAGRDRGCGTRWSPGSKRQPIADSPERGCEFPP